MQQTSTTINGSGIARPKMRATSTARVDRRRVRAGRRTRRIVLANVLNALNRHAELAGCGRRVLEQAARCARDVLLRYAAGEGDECGDAYTGRNDGDLHGIQRHAQLGCQGGLHLGDGPLYVVGDIARSNQDNLHHRVLDRWLRRWRRRTWWRRRRWW
eukprot:scaffold283816_cov27-Tisochrysis_lutea.AAC.1